MFLTPDFFNGRLFLTGRTFRELELAEPIRYKAGDPIEAWLNELLCLDAANHIPSIDGRCEKLSEISPSNCLLSTFESMRKLVFGTLLLTF